MFFFYVCDFAALLCVLTFISPLTVDTGAPLSQDEATEGTMSSEALPLIFDPSEDITSEAALVQTAAVAQSVMPGGTGPPAVSRTVEVEPQQPDGEEPSNLPSLDWTSPDAVTPLAPVALLPTERHAHPGEASHMVPGQSHYILKVLIPCH